MITFENLSFSYGNTGEEQLNSLDLQIKKGEFVLLCGRSACGKTTATKCINGLIPHFTEGKYSGSVVVKEKEIAKTPVYEIFFKILKLNFLILTLIVNWFLAWKI